MLRPSRPALLPHHRFRAGTAQTLQAAQGRARGRGQAGFWSCAPNPEVTAKQFHDVVERLELVEKTTTDLVAKTGLVAKTKVLNNTDSDTDSDTDSETGHVPTAVESIAERDTAHPHKAPSKIWTPSKPKQDNLYSLRCSRAGPTSKPRHSGYGDLRV